MTETKLVTVEEVWVLEVTRDLNFAKEVLTKVQYLMFKPKSDVLYNHLKSRFPRKERLELKNGFYVLMEGTHIECEKGIKDLENFLLGNTVDDKVIKDVKNDRMFKRVLDKFKNVKSKTYNSLMRETTPLTLFNQCGIAVKWYKKES